MLAVSLRETAIDVPANAARNGATFLAFSDPDKADTGAAYPIFRFLMHIFVDGDGVIRSIVLEDRDKEQAVAEASHLLKAPTTAVAMGK